MKRTLVIFLCIFLLILIVGCGKGDSELNDDSISGRDVNEKITTSSPNYDLDDFPFPDEVGREIYEPSVVRLYENEETYLDIYGRRQKFRLSKIFNYSVNLYINDHVKHLPYNEKYNYDNEFGIKPLPKKYIVSIPADKKRVKLQIGTEKGIIIAWMSEGELKRFDVNGRLNRLKVGLISNEIPIDIEFNDGSNTRKFKLLLNETRGFGQGGFIYVADILADEDEEFVTRNAVEFNLTKR